MSKAAKAAAKHIATHLEAFPVSTLTLPCITLPPFEDTELLNAKSIGLSSLAGHKAFAKMISLYDGDTGTFQYRDREGDLRETKCRFYGIDTAEMKPLKSTPNRDDHIAAGCEAVGVLEIGIKEAGIKHGANDIVYLHFYGPDMYGRELVEVYNMDGLNLNNWMILNKYAVPYDGKTKAKSTYVKEFVGGVEHYVAKPVA
jgi:endonuclease YncB( thermonuclease family)